MKIKEQWQTYFGCIGRRKFLFLMSVISLVFAAISYSAFSPNFPVVRLEATPTTLDVGEIKQSPFDVHFRVVNNGNRDVDLGRPLTSCTCAVVQSVPGTLEALKSMSLTAEIRGGKGRLNSEIRLPYKHADVERELRLTVTGTVLPHIVVSPESGRLNRVEHPLARFEIEPRYAPSVDISQAVTSHDSLKVKRLEKRVDGKWDLEIELVESNDILIPLGPYRASITVFTTSEYMPILEISVMVHGAPERDESLFLRGEGKS